MGRHNGHTNKGKPKPQGGGFPQRRKREHARDGAPSEPSNAESQRQPQGRSREDVQTRANWYRIFRMPGLDDFAEIGSALRQSGGNAKGDLSKALRFTSVRPEVAIKIRENAGTEKAKTLLDKYLSERSAPIEFEVDELYTFVGRNREIILGASPNDGTRNALNQDFIGISSTFGIDEAFRYRSMIIATYINQDTAERGMELLTETLQRQGGVLLTFGGAQI